MPYAKIQHISIMIMYRMVGLTALIITDLHYLFTGLISCLLETEQVATTLRRVCTFTESHTVTLLILRFCMNTNDGMICDKPLIIFMLHLFACIR